MQLANTLNSDRNCRIQDFCNKHENLLISTMVMYQRGLACETIQLNWQHCMTYAINSLL